jgi:hypothetical protein
MDKPKGKVQRIELSEEDQESIDTIMNGKPSAKTIQRWEDAGFNIEHKLKWYISIPPKERMHRIRQKYKIGVCTICRQFPVYKVTYDYDGITLVEWFCESHKRCTE